jgi:hypothetical protein
MLYTILFYEYAVIYLSMLDIWIICMLLMLWIILLWAILNLASGREKRGKETDRNRKRERWKGKNFAKLEYFVLLKDTSKQFPYKVRLPEMNKCPICSPPSPTWVLAVYAFCLFVSILEDVSVLIMFSFSNGVKHIFRYFYEASVQCHAYFSTQYFSFFIDSWEFFIYYLSHI